MDLLVGRTLSGPTLTELDEEGGLGCPCWDSTRLLADLELRLGLAPGSDAPLARAAAMSARIAARIAIAPGERFYSRSYRIDPIGTASALLDWRDELVMAGWNGSPVAAGGDRLAALAELEAVAEPPLPDGPADRVRAVERALARECDRARVRARDPIYRSIALLEPARLWPLRWRRIFALLSRAGAAVIDAPEPMPAASSGGDLGLVQARLASCGAAGPAAPASSALSGDGSFLVLRAGTSLEAARATAALLAAWGTDDAAVVRGGDAAILDLALAAQGLAPTGGRIVNHSAPRPALQVLPLAIDLLYEPGDPRRILELLALPGGPLGPVARHVLGRAVAESPGLGGPRWRRALDDVRDRTRVAAGARRAARELNRIESWIGGERHDPVAGAPREAVAAVARRVAGWVRGRRARDPDDPVLAAAHRQAQEFLAALAADPRERIDHASAARLATAAARGVAVELEAARAGRIDAVDQPAAFRLTRGTVVWWHFAAPEATPPPAPWRHDERRALAAAGIEIDDPAALAAAASASWRRPVLLAGRRLLPVRADMSMGEPLEPHPLWCEITAGLKAGELARVTVSADDLLSGRTHITPAPPVETVAPLRLPASRVAWKLPAGTVRPLARHSVSSLDALIGCPLRFLFVHAAGMRRGRAAAIPPPAMTSGTIGHRLIEELFLSSMFARGPAAFEREAGRVFDRLVGEEASALMLAGASFERYALRRQLIGAAAALRRLLEERGWEIDQVELSVEGAWRGGELAGRIDALVRTPDGREVVLDLKWGHRRYRAMVEEKRAVQLAAYAHLRRAAAGRDRDDVEAAYFSLSRGELVPDPDPLATWAGVERTALAVESALATGQVPATGTADAPALSEALGQLDLLAAPGGSACVYCEHDALCGRRWEAMS